jgi:hypothetical protein
MSLADFPAMLVSETVGWSDVERSHLPSRWFFKGLVLPLSMLPPLLYAYAEVIHPGVVFPLSVPALTAGELLATGIVFYVAEIWMVGFMAMLIQRMAMSRDHDPGYDGAYALAAIAPMPLWLGSLALLVPSFGFNLVVAVLALVASISLIRHGVRPLLHIRDEKTAHYVADMVTMAGVAVWIALLLVSGFVLSLFLAQRFF